MTDFRDAMMAAGLRPRDVPADGEWHRCPTDDKPKRRNGAYKLAVDGRVGFFIDFASGMGVVTWHAAGLTSNAPIDQSAIVARRARERQDRMAALRRVRAYWGRATPCTRLHPYLERKGLSALGTSGLREHDGHLVVPVWWRDRLISVQTIHPDGTKRFFAGCSVKGGSFSIARKGAAVTVLVEGLATGLALYQSVSAASVVVCFDAGNILHVVNLLRPTGSVCIFADNDHGTAKRIGRNPGIEAARNAAALIDCGVAWPDGIEGTDAADVLKEMGPGGSRTLQRLVHGGMRYVAHG